MCTVLACGGQQTPVEVAPVAAEPNLVSLLPSATTEVLRVRSSQLFAEPRLASLRGMVFEGEALERLEINFGFRPEDVDDVLFATIGGEPLVLVRAHVAVAANAEAIASRMNTVEYASDDPFRRSGFIGTERREVAVLSPRTLLYAAAMPEVAQVVQAARRGRSLRSHELPYAGRCSGSATPREPALLTWCSLRPIAFPPGAPVAMLLARHESACVDVRVEDEAVSLHIVFGGEFPQGADENLRVLARSLAASELAHLFAAEDALANLQSAHCDGSLEADARFSLPQLERGLGAVLAPTLREMLASPPERTASSP